MSQFPCPVERTVASALLLLSTRLDLEGKERMEFHEESLSPESKSSGDESLSLVSTGSRACASALSSDVSSQEFRDHQIRIDAVADRCQLMKLKTVTKRRSKVCWSTVNFKVTEVEPGTEISSETNDSKEESCLSSGGSEDSSQSKIRIQQNRDELELEKKYARESAPIRRRAEAILEYLTGNSSSEVKIRQVLGDTPDTSKALRMLLKTMQVKRSGSGGRQDPFIYMKA